MAMLFARWHHHIHFASGSLMPPLTQIGNRNFKVIQNPGFLSDHPQNWITRS